MISESKKKKRRVQYTLHSSHRPSLAIVHSKKQQSTSIATIATQHS